MRPPMRYRALEDQNNIMVQRWHDAIEYAQAHLVISQDRQTQYYDINTKLISFNVDEHFLLRISRVQTNLFYFRYEGPMLILKKISDLTYLVRDLKTNREFTTHVKKMKKVSKDVIEPTDIDSDFEPEAEPQNNLTPKTIFIDNNLINNNNVPNLNTQSAEVIKRKRGRPKRKLTSIALPRLLHICDEDEVGRAKCQSR